MLNVKQKNLNKLVKSSLCPYFTNISDFVDFLAPRYWKSFMASTFTLKGRKKKKKKKNFKLVTTIL